MREPRPPVLLLYSLETEARRGDGEYGRLYEGAEGHKQPQYSWPLPALIHWEVKVGGTGMKDVGGAVLMMMFITIFAGD